MNFTTPAKFLNFDYRDSTYSFTEKPEWQLIDAENFVERFDSCNSSIAYSVSAQAVFNLPGDESQIKNKAGLRAINEILCLPAGTRSSARRLACDATAGYCLTMQNAAHSDIKSLIKCLTKGTYPSGDPCYPTIRVACGGFRNHPQEAAKKAIYFHQICAVIAYCESIIEKFSYDCKRCAGLQLVVEKALMMIDEEQHAMHLKPRNRTIKSIRLVKRKK